MILALAGLIISLLRRAGLGLMWLYGWDCLSFPPTRHPSRSPARAHQLDFVEIMFFYRYLCWLDISPLSSSAEWAGLFPAGAFALAVILTVALIGNRIDRLAPDHAISTR